MTVIWWLITANLNSAIFTIIAYILTQDLKDNLEKLKEMLESQERDILQVQLPIVSVIIVKDLSTSLSVCLICLSVFVIIVFYFNSECTSGNQCKKDPRMWKEDQTT